jgi:subtilase family serine protease
LAVVAGAALVAIAATGGGSARSRGDSGLGVNAIQDKSRTVPLPTSQCKAQLGISCYSPAQFERAYDLAGLHAAGINGSGETIAIVDSFGSPTIMNDLHQFDQTFGVSNPYGVPIDPAIAQDPSLTIIQPAGAVPAFSTTAFNGDMVSWAEETTLDVEWAHVMAPKASILLVETPTDETEGVQGFPEIVTAENYVIDHHLAQVISQSFGATEETFPNQQALLDLRGAFTNAAANNVTVLGASGDEGSTDFELNLRDLYPMQVNSWPSSDPLVTSVGGTQMHLDDSGNRLSPDNVWNDSAVGIQAAGGGGVSSIFSRPAFQDGVQSVVGSARGTPDISMNAAVDGGVWVYYTFISPTSPYHIFGGTSAATPEFSGVVAMADQLAGHQLGDINNALYQIPYGGGLVDVTSGNNDIGPFVNSDNKTYHVPGFNAGPGYDLASGLGTVDPARFVPALAATASPATGAANCSGSMSFAAFTGDVQVGKGATCSLTDSAVHGSVSIAPGGKLTLDGTTVSGGVSGQGGITISDSSVIEGTVEIGSANSTSPSTICGSTIDGNLEVHNNASTTTIGTSPTCTTGNTIGGDVHVHNNAVAGAPSAVVDNNTIGQDLVCQKNSLAPTGSGNTVAGSKTGQCSGF